ncbi:MAG TPA: anthranilate synthase component I family protein [Solirubrobacteraceae bacterium]|jgi:anthranilate/para-aminobenzoate synthase component I|nr:anthranilate synthase component I family protein [Solirubrobacteraceae bacterium]
MPVTSSALADRTDAPSAELWRVRLPWNCGPELVLAALAHEPYLCCLSGVWAGGGTIIASEPLRVAEAGEDPFALLDELPRVGAGRAEAFGAVGGGWFGWLGYRLAARVEEIPLVTERPVPLPDFHLAYYDHVLHQDAYGFWWFEALATPARSAELEERLEFLRRRVADQRFAGAASASRGPSPLRLRSEVAEHHLQAVAECRERIAAGEIFQANICQRLEGEYDGSATELLRSALIGGRVPQYTAAFDTPTGGVVSLSPELFLRRQSRYVRSGPIKGTVHRPNDPERAVLSLRQLQTSAKDAAEHVMIVDLMRNDLGRVCEYGTVNAPRRPTAEAHPGLWHLVTTVEGRLRREVGNAQLLQAAFPPGSVTGAPKVQALKVIAELEPTGREVYTGAIGYASPLAGLELNVAIRTLELSGGRLWLGVGGGIVADSDPQAELEETLVKARPVAAAIGTTVISA